MPFVFSATTTLVVPDRFFFLLTNIVKRPFAYPKIRVCKDTKCCLSINYKMDIFEWRSQSGTFLVEVPLFYICIKALYITLPFIIILNATLIYDTWSSSIILLFYLMLFRQLLKMQPVKKNPKNISFSYVIYVYLCSTILRQPNSITTLEIINQKADKGSYVCLYKQ